MNQPIPPTLFKMEQVLFFYYLLNVDKDITEKKILAKHF